MLAASKDVLSAGRSVDMTVDLLVYYLAVWWADWWAEQTAVWWADWLVYRLVEALVVTWAALMVGSSASLLVGLTADCWGILMVGGLVDRLAARSKLFLLYVPPVRRLQNFTVTTNISAKRKVRLNLPLALPRLSKRRKLQKSSKIRLAWQIKI